MLNQSYGASISAQEVLGLHQSKDKKIVPTDTDTLRHQTLKRCSGRNALALKLAQSIPCSVGSLGQVLCKSGDWLSKWVSFYERSSLRSPVTLPSEVMPGMSHKSKVNCLF